MYNILICDDDRDIVAALKIYLTASTKQRALRRWKELKDKGNESDITDIEEDIRKRDFQDMNREISPLKQAEDAVLLDSSDLTIEEVIDKIISLFYEKQNSNKSEREF